jgi:hypothetical protein
MGDASEEVPTAVSSVSRNLEGVTFGLATEPLGRFVREDAAATSHSGIRIGDEVVTAAGWAAGVA